MSKEETATLGAAVIVGPDRLDELKRLLPQLAKLDQVVVVNTSPQGAITNYVRRLKKPFEVYEDLFRPSSVDPKTGEEYGINDWGFSRARNISLQKLRTNYGFWIDTDDFLGLVSPFDGKVHTITPQAVKDGFLKVIKEQPDLDVWFADYNYSYDEDGNANVVHARERLFKNPTTWKVVYPIHECFIPDHPVNHNVIRDIKFVHVPVVKPETSNERNMRMLHEWLAQLKKVGQSHDLARCRLQIGETYWGRHEYKTAARWLEDEYLANHPNAIDLEKWQACSFAAKSYIQIGNLAGAKRMALKAIDVEPALPDGYYLLAECKWLAEESPHDILQLVDYAARCDDPPPQVIRNPLDYTFTPNCIISACKFKQGQYEVALDFALKALRDKPSDLSAERLRAQAAEKLRIQDGAKAAVALYQLLKDYDEHEKAARFIANLPYEVQKDPEIAQVYEGAKERVGHLIDDKIYEEYFGDPPYWKPTDWGWFEKGYVPGADRYAYILSRIKSKPDAKRVLVIGCDDGYHSILLAKEGYEVTGIDLNKEAIRIANERAEKLGVSAKFIEGWFEKINFDSIQDLFDPEVTWEERFDVVVASEQLEKVKDIEMFMQGMGDCLKPRGAMILVTPSGSWDNGDVPYNRQEGQYPLTVRAFTQETLELLCMSNNEYTMTECHFLPYSNAYRDGQGWQVAEIVKAKRVIGPRIRVFCGELVESFSPLNLVFGGIGGSETAVIHMADYWTKMGALVTIYRGDADVPNNVGMYDGVSYRLAGEWSPTLYSDLFVAWRLPHLFAKGRPNAKSTVLWCHDIHFPIEVKPEWVENIDVIAVLSDWHKAYIMNVHPFPEEKVWVTRNGIEPARFKQSVEKEKHHYFFSSSHERGLEELLALWPKIKKAIPDAVLHVGYGTHTAAEVMKKYRNYEGLDELRAMEQSMYEMDGVVYHQRMNQWDLAKVQLQCEAWLYPYQHGEKWGDNGGFPETYCITALEAQAAGAIPFSRLNAALPETIKNVVEWTKEDTDKTAISKLKNLSKLMTPEQIEANRKWAVSKSWSSLAKQWLDKLIEKPKEEV